MVTRLLLKARRHVLADHQASLRRCLDTYPAAPIQMRVEWQHKLRVVEAKLVRVNARLRGLS